MPFSVVIPAHNEEAVIGRCLVSLLAGAPPGELEVLVVCNGCEDETAEMARRAAPDAKVIEISVASKVAALNAGDDHATYFPRFYVDADVELTYPALLSVARALQDDGVLCAAPRPLFDLKSRPWAVRAFYAVLEGVPYFSQDMVGTGVYALSEQGRRRFGAFPELIADDQFVQQLFERPERKSVAGAHFVVHPPANLRGVLAMRARAYRGNRELAESGLARAEAPPSGLKSVLRRALAPAQAPAVAVYAGVNILAKGWAYGRPSSTWERDNSARALAAHNGSSQETPVASKHARVCYVTSHYPALSHTFVMREILGLRAAGAEVDTVSVHKADEASLLAEVDRREAERTWNIFPLKLGPFLRVHAGAVLRHPAAYLRTLGKALRAAPDDFRGPLWQLFYFAEAIALWDHAKHLGTRHLHAHLANVAADICWWATEFGDLAEGTKTWRWSFTMHGPTELFDVGRFNLARKVAHADLVVCISEFTRSQLMYVSQPEHWEKLEVVHCGADLSRYPLQPPRQGPGLVVLCVARLAAQKGLEVLLSAVKLVSDRGIDGRLLLVGEGPMRDRLHRRTERLGMTDRVRFEGAVGQDEMASYYAAADVFCLPSFAEGIPIVLMEAMASGRPVVATRIAGVPELVEEGVSGLLVAPGNVAELVAALERLASSPQERQSMGMAGRGKVVQDFDAQRCAAQLAGLFQKLTAAA
ncbi:MAG TPA: glycosyltransferase [Acidimicrobiales bacterium]|nr:glycosyltransferase [Acidimicrobiales bacterium]